MDNNTSYLNKHPIEKLKYLKALLQKDNLSSNQIIKIKKIIKDTILELKKLKENQNQNQNRNQNLLVPMGTKDLTKSGRQLVKLKQETNYNELTNTFYSQEEKDEVEFNLKLEKQ